MEQKVGNNLIKDDLELENNQSPSSEDHLADGQDKELRHSRKQRKTDTQTLPISQEYNLEQEFRFESEIKKSEVKKIYDLWIISLKTYDKPTFALEQYLFSLGIPKDVLEGVKIKK